MVYFSVTITSKQLTFRTRLSYASAPSSSTISSTVFTVFVRSATSQSPCCSNQLARLRVFSIAFPVPMTVTTIGLAASPVAPAAVLVLRLRAATRDCREAFLGAGGRRSERLSCLRTRLTADMKGVLEDMYMVGDLEEEESWGRRRGRFWTCAPEMCQSLAVTLFLLAFFSRWR